MGWIPKSKISCSFLIILVTLYGIGLWNAPSPILDRSPYSDPIWAKLTIIPLVMGLFETGLFLVTSPGKVEDYVDRKGWFLTQEEFYFLNEYNEKIWLLDENEKNLALNLDKFRKSNKKQEYLKNLTNFYWDEACSFPQEAYMFTEVQQRYLEKYKFNKKIDGHTIVFFNKKTEVAYVVIFKNALNFLISLRTHQCKNKNELILEINE